MQKQTSHIFKIFKSSWGIWTQFTAQHQIVSSISSDCLMASEKVGLKLNSNHKKLHEDYKTLLIKGLGWITNNIEATLPDKLIEIELIDFKANPTDFQPEGFYYGIADWAANHFGFKLPDYNYTCNKEENKYEFPDLRL